MKINITWTITTIIAVSSFFSPIIVACINNYHHSQIRKMELKHDEQIRWLNLQQDAVTKQFDIYYADKKQAFSDFSNAAGSYFFNNGIIENYNILCSSAHTAMLFSNSANRILLSDFMNYADSIFGLGNDSKAEREKYSRFLNELTKSLTKNLRQPNQLYSANPVNANATNRAHTG